MNGQRKDNALYITPSTRNLILTLSETASMWTSEALPSRACLKITATIFRHRRFLHNFRVLASAAGDFFCIASVAAVELKSESSISKSPKARETSPPNPLYSPKRPQNHPSETMNVLMGKFTLETINCKALFASMSSGSTRPTSKNRL